MSEDLGQTAAPHLEPEVALEWPDFQNPELASVSELVLSGQLRFIARQNQALMGMVQNLYSAISKSQSRRSSISSTGASSDAGDSVHLRMPDENAKRVAQAYQTLIEGGEIYETVARLHGVFVLLNSKKLYVMRTTTSAKDAQTFAQYVIKQIEDQQSDPAGQEDTDLVERQDVILTNMKLLTPDLATDLYIMLNKAKKASDLKDQPDTTKRKATGKKKAKVIQDRASAVLTGDGGNHESDDGTEDRNLESTRTTAGGPFRQVSFSSQAGSPTKRSLRSRQISGSSGVGADAAASSQHSQASATTIQRRRSKQKTRFALSDNDDDGDSEDAL
ncbi:hypothetical protein FMUND_2243 [Fusarium mundagurra]|uniref:Uncharacterized protein n=1 Tax=Fusarium mundagurra TaxID=1567541 RepID=A0A8H5Z2G0_9HYPO|nr:hypothetical protein FMUND_2243 [Fusarium mundagurra]